MDPEETPLASVRTCSQCFFRIRDLCALPLLEPCATFRPATRIGLVPPPQASLIERPLVAVSAQLV